MRLLKLEATNFGSYPNLSFDFTNLGLSLVFGPTGSGKSTICDAACWVLYGVTAKGGNADEVRSWLTTEPTKGELYVETANGTMVVCRSRSGHKNDLFWTEEGSSDAKRGKDLVDTQKLLSERLGVSEELYLTGAYFSEFSETGRFFMAKSNERRVVFERIAKLDLPASLGSRSSTERTVAKDRRRKLVSDVQRLSGKEESLAGSASRCKGARDGWQKEQEENLKTLKYRAENFQREKESKIEALKTKAQRHEEARLNRIDALATKIEKLDAKIIPVERLRLEEERCLRNEELAHSERCPTCDAPIDSPVARLVKGELEDLKETKRKNDYYLLERSRLEVELTEETLADGNFYLDQLKEAEADCINSYAEQYEIEASKINPFIEQIQQVEAELVKCHEAKEQLNAQIKELDKKVDGLSHLYDLAATLRGALLQRAVREVEKATNYYLEKYFDAEIRVGFSVEDADKLDVVIHKSGYECVYRQLSKGQRGLLKLCFVVAIMKAAANTAGQHFSALFMDEALDGLDSDLKVKAFSLFEELEKDHESILLIEHAPEFQALFNRRFRVSMEADQSSISEE